MKKLLVILLLWSAGHWAGAQVPVDLAKITQYTEIKKYTFYADAGKDASLLPQQVLALPYVQAPDTPVNRYSFLHDFYFSFSVTNSGPLPDSVLFYPGMVIAASVFEVGTQPGQLHLLPTDHVHYTQISGQQLLLPQIMLRPGETRRFIVKPRFRHFNYRDWRPTLVKHNSVLNMTYEYRVKPEINFMFTTLFFLGMMTTMCFYAFLRFYTSRLREFLYYGLSALCFILYFFYQFGLLFNFSETYNNLDLFLKQFLQIGAHIFYMRFATAFLNLRKNMPVLYRVMKVLYVVLAVYLTIVLFTAFNDRYYSFNMMMFNSIRILLLLYSLYAIPVLFVSRAPLAKYVATGGVAVAVFSGIAFYFSNVPIGFTSPFFYAIGGPIAFFKLGILIEQVCFILGLTRKLQLEATSRIKAVELLRIDNEKKEFEKFMAVLETREKERTRIAQEIHDDIGSGLTTIRLLSEIMKAKSGTAGTPEIDKISSSANELIENMNEIIWSFNSRNDTLPNLVAYIRRYVVSYFEHTSMEVKIAIPAVIPPVQISGDFRRSVFLVVKESLHNIMKHALANRVQLTVEIDTRLTVTLADNGKGFSEDEVKLFSNGLRGMRERMESTGGSFSITGNNGTAVKLSMPL